MSDQKNNQPAVPFKYKPSPKKVLDQLTTFAGRYKPFNYKEDLVLELEFTDLDSRYQLVLGESSCIVKTDDFLDFTTQIKINFDIFQEVAFKGLCIKEVILKEDCQINGAFDTIMYFEDYFNLTKK
ncbi:MAG: hypothetical protein L6276_12120, partial [Acetobacterium sp.]|nr:hypothetical protein [Acetobacterium sp.]